MRRKHGREAGVASVVALMLLLAVIVTFLSLYATTYLPALKQQAEIEQVTSVKEAFMRFDNDIDHVISDGTAATYGETVPLGGGDILLDPEKSSGLLSVGDPQALSTIQLTWSNGTAAGSYASSLVNVSYVPSYTFWEAQGYTWQYGYINVTKGGRSTPLSYNTMGDVNARRIPGYAGKLLEITPVWDTTTPSVLDRLVITAVTMEPSGVPGDKNFVSGNGACVLRINATVTTQSLSTTSQEGLTVSVTPGDTSTYFVQQQMGAIGQTNSSLAQPPYTLTLPQSPDQPVTVIVNQIHVSVYVQ